MESTVTDKEVETRFYTSKHGPDRLLDRDRMAIAIAVLQLEVSASTVNVDDAKRMVAHARTLSGECLIERDAIARAVLLSHDDVTIQTLTPQTAARLVTRIGYAVR